MSGMDLSSDEDDSIKSHEEIVKGIGRLVELEEEFQPYDITKPEEEEFIDLELTRPKGIAEETPTEFLDVESEFLQKPEFIEVTQEEFTIDKEFTESPLPEFEEAIDEDISKELPLEFEEEVERSGLLGRLGSRLHSRKEEILLYEDELDEEPIELEPLLEEFDPVILSQASIFKFRLDEDGNLVFLDKRKPREKKPHPKLEAFLSKIPLRMKRSEEKEETEEESRFSKLKGVFGRIKSILPIGEKEEESEEEEEEEEET